MTPELILIIGGLCSALLGLVGIWLTKKDGTRTIDMLTEDELRSYRISRLVEGFGFCTLCKHEYRLVPGGSQTACQICLPPERKPIWEPHHQEEHAARPLNFGKSYAPLHTWWPGLFQKGEEQ